MRREDWWERLELVIAKHDALPFEYGRSDCALLTIEAIEALTGYVPPALVGEYDSLDGALRLLKARGFHDLGDAFADCFAEVHPSHAWRGDVGIADYPGAFVGGGVIVLGTDVIGKGETGLVRLPRSHLMRTFRVE